MDMGLFGSKFKDVYSNKWTTADIQSADRVWFVPIRYQIGNYFLAELDGLIYCFTTTEQKIKTWKQTGIKGFSKIYYNIDHWSPLSPADAKDLEVILTKNGLPKMNTKLFNVFKILGSREKENFEPHDIARLVEEIGMHREEYKEQVDNLINYLDHLNVDKIITPLRKTTDYLESDFKATSPQFMGSVVTAAIKLDEEHKVITNKPVNAKKPWLKFMVIMMLIGVVAGLGYWAYSSGAFSHLVPTIGSAGPVNSNDLMKQYPTPEALNAACDAHKLDCTALPKDVQDFLSHATTPQAIPQSK